jgi:peptide/nickel transport system permease protein
MIAIGVSATPIFVRLTRAQVLNVKVEDYIEAARAVGNPPWAHRLAACAAQRDRAADRAGDAGDRRGGDRRGEPVVPRPRPAAAGAELGQHAQHREELRRQRAVDGDLAGLSIFLLVLGFNLLGDGLRDALDPRQR